MQEEDQEIVAAIGEGRLEWAFQRTVALFSERLYWHIRSLVLRHEEADDVLQETMLKVWKNLASFRAESKLYTWLYRIATNEALAHLRREKRRPQYGGEAGAAWALEKASADPYYCGEEMEKALLAAVHRLPEKQQLVFKLRYFEEMKYQDMADSLETSVGALKASYHHARQKIEADLLNQGWQAEF